MGLTLLLLTVFFTFSAQATDLFPSLDFRGASITKGFAAGASLESRYERQLFSEPQATRAKISSVRTLVALDYFFVTHFTKLRSGSEQDFIQSFESVLSSWLSENDAVVVGLLPVEAELSPEMREFLRSHRGRAFASPFFLLRSCCSDRAAVVNQRLRALAATNNKIWLFDWASIIESYMLSPQLDPSPQELFADSLHINRTGQKVLYNLKLKSVFEEVWGVPLRPIQN